LFHSYQNGYLQDVTQPSTVAARCHGTRLTAGSPGAAEAASTETSSSGWTPEMDTAPSALTCRGDLWWIPWASKLDFHLQNVFLDAIL
jgi:hypothetical protein